MGRPQNERRRGNGRGIKPYQPALGQSFEIQEVDARTRGFLARIIVVSSVAGLGASGAYSLLTRNFMAVLGVWGVVGPLLAAIMAYYFGPQGNDTE